MPESIFIIKVESGGYYAGNYAKISLNHAAVYVGLNESGHLRGL